MIDFSFIFLYAFMFDFFIGDPKTNLHPVVFIGNLISFLEKKLLKKEASKKNQIIAGTILLLLTTSIVYFFIVFLLKIIALFNNKWVYILSSALILSFTISPRALKEAAYEIYKLLVNKNIKEARRKVGWIVGRDTENLKPSEITRATIETVSESITDGVISPLFYAFLGGAPLAFTYRAINTLDSMVGYKNERYMFFGMPSAKVDDVFNFIPARITAILILIVVFFMPNVSFKNALYIVRRDAKKHPSPNSGYAEATVAGALNIRLGGYNYYFGKPSFREYMGDDNIKLDPFHIIQTVKIMYLSTILFIIILIIFEAVLWQNFYMN